MKVSMSAAFLGSFAPTSSSSDRMDHTAEPAAQADNEARDLSRGTRKSGNGMSRGPSKIPKTGHSNETPCVTGHESWVSSDDEDVSHGKASAMNQ